MTHDTTREDAALDSVLRALIAHRKTRAANSELNLVSPSSFEGRQIPTRMASDLAHLARDPIGAALRQAVRRIGERLYEIVGSTGALSEAAERIADMDETNGGRRAVIMDHAWDGIGRDGDRWMC